MAEEIWKDIKGYEGLYQVSNLGRVKSLDRVIIKNNGFTIHIKEKILQNSIDRKGYPIIGLCKMGKCKTKPIHRLVADAFIPNPENKPEIDHIDTDPTNNRVENLRWCTRQENCNNPLTIKHQKISQKGKKLSDDTKKKISEANKGRKCYWEGKIGKEHPKAKHIIQFTPKGELVRKWDCITDAERQLNIHHANILKVINGERNCAGGYKWEYYNTDRYLIALMIKTLKEREMRKGVA